MLRGLNHITLAVSDIENSLEFYEQALGFHAHVKWDSGAYLTLGELWLCLSRDSAVQVGKDYTHIAFDVAKSDFPLLCQKLNELGVVEWKTNCSEGGSLYILDPDGHQLEVHSGDLESRLKSLKSKPYKGLIWL
ncbi:fosfomycin resistance glutathione transferase [Aliikangiella sp. IMCC44359]|uniref:fosfomycin resistance glutathione transferase n=1 Tax=Aliikangiella sp. IMCC44359 TaxID=3459125 RepID=UPI00403AE78E